MEVKEQFRELGLSSKTVILKVKLLTYDPSVLASSVGWSVGRCVIFFLKGHIPIGILVYVNMSDRRISAGFRKISRGVGRL